MNLCFIPYNLEFSSPTWRLTKRTRSLGQFGSCRNVVFLSDDVDCFTLWLPYVERLTATNGALLYQNATKLKGAISIRRRIKLNSRQRKLGHVTSITRSIPEGRLPSLRESQSYLKFASRLMLIHIRGTTRPLTTCQGD